MQLAESQDLKSAWSKVSRGDPVTDAELDGMIAQAEAAVPYLSQRSDYGMALRDTVLSLAKLQDMRRERARITRQTG